MNEENICTECRKPLETGVLCEECMTLVSPVSREELDYFNARPRYTIEQMQEILAQPSNAIVHGLDNGDGTYSIVSHIVCEFCDYCAEGGDVHPAKVRIYEKQAPYYYIHTAAQEVA